MRRFVVFLLSMCAAAVVGETPAAGDAPSEIAELRAMAGQGDRGAQLRMGMRCRDGDGVPQDHEAALMWYRKCADQGDAEGMDNVGFMYLQGWGVPVNFDIAFGYFKASAAENHAQGLFNLGNCCFSGQGVEQDYARAIASWRRAEEQGHENAIWRLATLYAAGEGLPRDRKKAESLARRIAEKGHVNGALLLGELLASQGKIEEAHEWWTLAARRGSRRAEDLLELDTWRRRAPVLGSSAFVEVDHLYQGWNNCGATSIAMFARSFGADVTPYDVKRLCPRSPIGTGTDWADLVAACETLDQTWTMATFPNDEDGFTDGVALIRKHLDAGEPVVIDFTVTRDIDGEQVRFGHTLLVVGYNTERDQFVLKNPNQPSPGIELMSTDELKANWYSGGYSRLAKGCVARPLIVKDGERTPK